MDLFSNEPGPLYVPAFAGRLLLSMAQGIARAADPIKRAFVDEDVEGMWTLAMVVFIASILAPLLKLLALLYVLLPLHFGRQPWRMAQVFRWIETLHPWAMTEVYLLGVLVAFVKLSDIATIVPGVALYSFAALIVVMAATDAALEPEAIWERLEPRR